MAKRNKCCGENNILRYLMYGVFTPNAIDQCCQDIPIPNFGEHSANASYVESDSLTYGNSDCTYHLHVKFETTGHWHDSVHIVEFYDGYTFVTLDRSQWYSWNYNNSTASPIYFSLTNLNHPTEGKCIMMHFKNTTCNLNYGAVGELCSTI